MTEHTSSYYAASANKYAPFDTLNESISCDVCVVGGGYTGLSSALHLAEAGFDVVVLEASRIGFGASGRNGGQLVNSYSRDIDVIEKSYGMDTARMLGSMMFEGGEIIRERIKRYQIDCDYRPGGLFVAMNDKQLATLEEQKENWERYGNKQLELLDANAIRRESGHGVTCTHLAGRLIAELLRGDAERFDAFANLPHYPFPGGRTLRVPFTAMGAAYYSLRDRLGV
ncbi:FAD-binding oxidoreductase [Escherichia coli]|nr:FAD-binding oxidoreductase [Escherichia coli]EKH4136745.1 FAD-binding oxidoreductase [Escherichia coli]